MWSHILKAISPCALNLIWLGYSCLLLLLLSISLGYDEGCGKEQVTPSYSSCSADRPTSTSSSSPILPELSVPQLPSSPWSIHTTRLPTTTASAGTIPCFALTYVHMYICMYVCSDESTDYTVITLVNICSFFSIAKCFTTHRASYSKTHIGKAWVVLNIIYCPVILYHINGHCLFEANFACMCRQLCTGQQKEHDCA